MQRSLKKNPKVETKRNYFIQKIQKATESNLKNKEISKGQKKKNAKRTENKKNGKRIYFEFNPHSVSSSFELETHLNPEKVNLQNTVEGPCLNTIKDLVKNIGLIFNRKAVILKWKSFSSIIDKMVEKEEFEETRLKTYQDWANAMIQLFRKLELQDHFVLKLQFWDFVGLVDAENSKLDPKEGEFCFKQEQGINAVVMQVAEFMYNQMTLTQNIWQFDKFVYRLEDLNKYEQMNPQEMQTAVREVEKSKATVFETFKKVIKNNDNTIYENDFKDTIEIRIRLEIWHHIRVFPPEGVQKIVDQTYTNFLKHPSIRHAYNLLFFYKKLIDHLVETAPLIADKLVLKEFNPGREARIKAYLADVDKVCRQNTTEESCLKNKCEYKGHWIFWKKCRGMERIPIVDRVTIKEIVRKTESESISKKST